MTVRKMFESPGPSHEVISVCRALTRSCGGVRAIDLGAGTGRNTLFLAAEGCRVTAVDVSPTGIQALQNEAALYGLVIDCIQADIRMTATQGSFEMVLMLGILHYLTASEARNSVRKAQARTEPGGIHLITRAEQPPKSVAETGPPANAPGSQIGDAELLNLYAHWQCLAYERYTKSDYHPGHGAHTLHLSKMVFRAPAPTRPLVVGVPHTLVDLDPEIDRRAEGILTEANLMTVSGDDLLGYLGPPDHLVEHAVGIPRRISAPREDWPPHLLQLFLWGKRIAYVENGLLVGSGHFLSNSFHTYASRADR